MTGAAPSPPSPDPLPSSPGSNVGGTPTQAISRYLSQLAVAAVGLDSAVVNDMLADAEQHLWNAVNEGVPVDRAITEFGEPRDVVAAYLEAEVGRGRGKRGGAVKVGEPPAMIAGGQVVAAAAMPERKHGLAALPVVGVWGDRHAWGSLLLFTVGILVAKVLFFVVLGWGIASLTLTLVIIGFPLLVALLGFCRVAALGYGRLIEGLTGVRMPRRSAPVPGTGMMGFWGRIKLWLSDGRSWLSAAFLLGNYPVVFVLCFVFVSLLSASLTLTFGPISELFMPDEWFENGNGFHLGPWHGGRIPGWLMVFSMLLGLMLATGMLWLAKGCGWLYAQVAKAIQVTRPLTGVAVQGG